MIPREELVRVWRTNPFQCFPWETIEILASNPNIKDVQDLEETLGKIVHNRSNK